MRKGNVNLEAQFFRIIGARTFIEVLDELELFIDKKVIFDEKKFSVGPPSAICHLPSVNKFCNPHNFFSFQPRHFSFSG
jgi:hypothetical protein